MSNNNEDSYELDSDEISVSSIKALVSDNLNEDENQEGEQPEVSKDPVLNQYHEACQMGDLKTVKELIESGTIDIKHDWDDIERVSGIHFASGNNRLNLVKYLISQGADVNMKAGDFEATPLHWASKMGYVYIVHALIENGADLSLLDKQGFDALHIATFSSNIMLVLYLLFTERLSVDSADPTGKTSLHWAAYQGDLLTVKALLRFQASVKVTDNNGFTPLHWAILKGQCSIIKELVENGSDVFQKNNDGKNSFTLAREMKTEHTLEQALYECGFNKDGYPLRKYFSNPLHAKAVTFLTPTFVIGLVLGSIAYLNTVFSLLILAVTMVITRYALFNFVLPSFILKRGHGLIFETPLLPGVIWGTIFWMFYIWIFKVFPFTATEMPLTNILMLVLFGTVIMLFAKLIQSDPGCIQAESDYNEIRSTMKYLIQTGKFDAKHFCIHTWVRVPLRAKYKSSVNSLIARYDHFCPWIYNHVGFRNHKMFMYFVLLLVVGIATFYRLVFGYFNELEDAYEGGNEKLSCSFLGDDELCAGFTYDPHTFFTLIWVGINLLWLMGLLFVQTFEACKGVTDYEFYQWNRKRKGLAVFEDTFNSTPQELADKSEQETPVQLPRVGSTSQRHCCSMVFAIVGLDRFINVLKTTRINKYGNGPLGESSEHSSVSFPIETDYGWKQNLKDFWLTSDFSAPLWRRLLLPPSGSKGTLNGEEVDYFKLYKLPERVLAIEDIV
ncbi:HCL288Cp [Eremothecium sinecaudum]|uniref:Palmitoyltransferase n=1 Tax=Eremothecium sinecaudum TaxID=45286 RepID=A0A109UYB9_9SACH|nr:HCL288Cp [Eremothecium sinecaudum]AMD19863.1 HCL288Cp [Eremothecium sinecaudum]